MLWIVLAGLALAIVAYVFARPYLLRIPAWARFCAWIDPLVVSWLTRSRQIALARLTMLSGFLLPVLDWALDLNIDWSSLLQALTQIAPETWRPTLNMMAGPVIVGAIGEILRRVTREPVSAKE